MPGDVIGEAWVLVRPETTGFAQALERGTAGGLASFGAKVGLVFAAAGAGIVGFAVDVASKFDVSLSAIDARMNLTKAQGQAIGDAFLLTAGKVTFSADTIAAAFAPVSGQLDLVQGRALTAAETMSFMSAAMDLAEASGQPLKDTTAALAQVMQAYGIGVAGASHASDLLWNASRALNIPVGDLAGIVDKLHAKLGPLAPSLADVSTTLLDVASHGLTGNRALLLVSTGMNTLLGGSKGTADEVKKLGLTLFTASGQFVGMQSVIGQLAPKLAGLTEQQRLHAEKELFGAGASKALDDTLLAGLPGWDAAAKAADKTGTAHASAAKATDNLKGAFERAKSGVTDFLVKIGTALIPVLTTVANWISQKMLPALQSFFNTIQQHMPQIQAGFQTFGTVVRNIMGVVIEIFNVAGHTVGEIISIIVAIIENIVGVVQAVVIRIGVLIGVFIDIFKVAAAVVAVPVGVIIFLVQSVVNVIQGIVHAMQDVVAWGGWKTIGAIFKLPFDLIAGYVGAVVTVIRAIVTGVGDVVAWPGWKTIGGVFKAAFDPIAKTVGAVVAAIEAIVAGIKNAITWLGNLLNFKNPLKTIVEQMPPAARAAWKAANPADAAKLGLAAGGSFIVPATSGGVPITVGEGGRDELVTVTPLSARRSTASASITQHNTFHVGPGADPSVVPLIESAIQRNNVELARLIGAR